jgi:hypothetical protein
MPEPRASFACSHFTGSALATSRSSRVRFAPRCCPRAETRQATTSLPPNARSCAPAPRPSVLSTCSRACRAPVHLPRSPGPERQSAATSRSPAQLSQPPEPCPSARSSAPRSGAARAARPAPAPAAEPLCSAAAPTPPRHTCRAAAWSQPACASAAPPARAPAAAGRPTYTTQPSRAVAWWRRGREEEKKYLDGAAASGERKRKRQIKKNRGEGEMEFSQGLMRKFRKLQGPLGKVKFPINSKP